MSKDDPKGIIKISGAITREIKDKVRREDGEKFSDMFVSHVIRDLRKNDIITKLYNKMLKIKNRRNRKMKLLREKMVQVDEQYLKELNEIEL